VPTAVEIVEFRPLYLEISHGGGEVVIGVDGRFHGGFGESIPGSDAGKQ
jgi:hypothetical protein